LNTYINIERKEFARIGYNGFLFPHSYSDDDLGATHLGLHLRTHAEKETRYFQYGPLLFVFKMVDASS
jgi:cupin superfamily acireductone dioxygenase involved in methionine salvage